MTTRRFTLALLVSLATPILAVAQGVSYPATRKAPQVDVYFGDSVPDPYRWLEDENAPETTKWVEAENKVTFNYLDKIPYRDAVKARLQQLFNYPKYGAPYRKGDDYLFSKNDGLQNQSVRYIQKGLNGTPEVLLDPNKFSVDGTSQLSTFALS
ncbi:MAG: S9 family peptidase, partial [Gemmatimonadaceae bacterium]